MMKIFARVAVVALLLSSLAGAQSFSQLTASSIQDAGNNLLATGTITWLPTDNNDNPIPVMGTIPRPVTCLIVNGAITTQKNGLNCQVLDSLLTTPPNLCYRVTIHDTSPSLTTFPEYKCVQPHGTSWSWDTYVPNLTPNVMSQYGPGFNWRGVWSSGSTYGVSTYGVADTVSYSTGGATSTYMAVASSTNVTPGTDGTKWVLLASGAAGANGAAGAGFITGLASDGSSGIAVTGAIAGASLKDTGITGSTQCVQANSTGVLSGTGSACGAGGGSMVYPGAGIPNSTGSAWSTSYTLQGNTTKLFAAGTVSGTGATLCTDASGNATTTGCPSGAVSSVFGRTGAVVATTGDYTLTNIGAGTAGSGTYDFSGVTLLKARVGAGLTTSANGDFGYDTTAKKWHLFINGADAALASVATTNNYNDLSNKPLNYNSSAQITSVNGVMNIQGVNVSNWLGRGVYCLGDSLTSGVGEPVGYLTYNLADYCITLQNLVGGTSTNFGVSGSQAADISRSEVFPNLSPRASNNNAVTLIIGTNDSNNANYAADTYQQQIFSNALLATGAWSAIPDNYKVLAQSASVTTTGTWSNDNTVIAGYAMQSTASASTMAIPITVTAPYTTAYLYWRAFDGKSGVFTANMDGGANTTLYGSGSGTSVGLNSGTYTSGITATGILGQTCLLSSFNNGNTGATATVALAGPNTIAGGTALVFTAPGIGNTANSTSAAVAAGTAASCTGTATVAAKAVLINTLNALTDTIYAYRFSGLSAGSHTINIAVTSSTNANNIVSIIGAATPSPAQGPGSPVFFPTGVPKQQGDANSSITAAYDTLANNQWAQLYSDGLQVYPVPVRSPNTVTIGFGAIYPPALIVNSSGPTIGTLQSCLLSGNDMANGLHWNDCGNAKVAAAFAYVMNPLGLLNQSPLTVNSTNKVFYDGGANAGVDTTMSTGHFATKFAAQTTGPIGDICVRVKNNGSITNGTAAFLTMQLEADSSGVPSGSALGTSRVLYFGNLTGSYVIGGTCFQPTNNVGITSGSVYWADFFYNSAPAGASILFDSAAGTNLSATSTTGGIGTWTNTSTPIFLQVHTVNTNAVAGVNQNGPGTSGTSYSGTGSVGSSTVGYGVQGSSTHSRGGDFSSTYGVGLNATSLNNNAISATGTTQTVVNVTATSGKGVVATSSSTGIGGQFQNTGTGIGVYGQNTSTGDGVQATSAGGIAIHSTSTSGTDFQGDFGILQLSKNAAGTNIASNVASITAGAGTGNSTPNTLSLKAPALGTASGGTVQTQVTRMVLNDTKALTSASAMTVVSIPLATTQMTGGWVTYHIEGTDGTSQCTLDGDIHWAGENSAGTFVVAPAAATGNNQANSCTSGKTLTATWTLTGANPALLQVTATTNITTTSFNIVYEAHNLGQTAVTF